MSKVIHPIAGAVALLMIASFWLSTVLVELSGRAATIATVKSMIPWGFSVLIPALIVAAISGRSLAKKRGGPILARKQKRMPFIAANGILILVPSAFYLSFKAQAGDMDVGFYLVQALELIAGAVNITLLGLNTADGLRLSGKLRRPPVSRG